MTILKKFYYIKQLDNNQLEMIKKNDFLDNKSFYINEIKKGKIFIYPTDTVLGIGCNAYLDKSIEKIYDIKKRTNKPFLVIIPSINWIKENCLISKETLDKIKEKLPGKFSFILKLKNKIFPSDFINRQKTIGIRIPKNWFYEIIKESNLPFITTSLNFSGENPIIKIDDIPKDFLDKVDYIIDDDENLSGKSSTIIDLSGEKEEIIRK